MHIVVDTSALLAVIVDEPERERIISATGGHMLIGPGSIPWEVGNAFSAMMKQGRLNLDRAHKGLEVFAAIPLRYVETDLQNALSICAETNMYAYDGYLLDCAQRYNLPLLTLDRRLRRAAASLEIQLMEI